MLETLAADSGNAGVICHLQRIARIVSILLFSYFLALILLIDLNKMPHICSRMTAEARVQPGTAVPTTPRPSSLLKYALRSCRDSMLSLLPCSVISGVGELDSTTTASATSPHRTESVLLLDVRDADAFDQCHIYGGSWCMRGL